MDTQKIESIAGRIKTAFSEAKPFKLPALSGVEFSALSLLLRVGIQSVK